MNRRAFLRSVAGMGLAALTPAVLAQGAVQPSSVTLVELINFHCSRCRAVNGQFERIEQAARDAGMAVRVGPVAWDTQSLWPDRVYYALRDLYPAVEADVRAVLFDGIQNDGQRFEDITQVMAFLERRKVFERAAQLDASFRSEKVIDYASSNTPLQAEMRAIRLIEHTGATEVPVFVWVKGGKVISSLTPAAASEPGALVQQVIQRIASFKS